MPDRYGLRDSTARIEAVVQAALNSDQGKRKLACARETLHAQLTARRLTAEDVLETYKRLVDKAVANHLSCGSRDVSYHAYSQSGIAAKEARRLADNFLSDDGRR